MPARACSSKASCGRNSPKSWWLALRRCGKERGRKISRVWQSRVRRWRQGFFHRADDLWRREERNEKRAGRNFWPGAVGSDFRRYRSGCRAGEQQSVRVGCGGVDQRCKEGAHSLPPAEGGNSLDQYLRLDGCVAAFRWIQEFRFRSRVRGACDRALHRAENSLVEYELENITTDDAKVTQCSPVPPVVKEVVNHARKSS